MQHLHAIFINCLKYGYMLNSMIVSTLLPIPKDSNDLQISQRYQQIAPTATFTEEIVLFQLYW